MQSDNTAWLLTFLTILGVEDGTAARFAAKVQMPDDLSECWLWIVAIEDETYGVFWDGLRTTSAHRIMYEWVNGPVGSLVVDHAICQHPPCVNPWHGEAVTQSENILRGNLRQYTQTHCKRDHEFTPENTRMSVNTRTGKLMRQCRACQRIRQAGYRASSSGRRKAA